MFSYVKQTTTLKQENDKFLKIDLKAYLSIHSVISIVLYIIFMKKIQTNFFLIFIEERTEIAATNRHFPN